jgi:hypothetical protein
VGVTAVLTGILIMCRNILVDGVNAVATGDELRRIRRLVRQLYCTPACRDGFFCSLVDQDDAVALQL